MNRDNNDFHSNIHEKCGKIEYKMMINRIGLSLISRNMLFSLKSDLEELDQVHVVPRIIHFNFYEE